MRFGSEGWRLGRGGCGVEFNHGWTRIHTDETRRGNHEWTRMNTDRMGEVWRRRCLKPRRARRVAKGLRGGRPHLNYAWLCVALRGKEDAWGDLEVVRCVRRGNSFLFFTL